MKSNNSQKKKNGPSSTKNVGDNWRKILLTKSRAQIIAEFEKQGYQVPKDTKIWKTKEYVGMEIGRHEHSCHIDTIEMIVIFFLDYPDNFYDSYIDLWLTEVV